MTAKVRHGARVTKRYDRAQTPYQRLLAAGVLDASQQQALAVLYQPLNPVALRTQIQAALHTVWQLADRAPAATPPSTGVRRLRAPNTSHKKARGASFRK